jgi:threonyl-tRNA synthetase
MLVVGDKEVSDRSVAVRAQKKGDVGPRPLDQFVTDALAEVRSKALS